MIRKNVYRRFILYFLMFGMCIITLFLYLVSQSEKTVSGNFMRETVSYQQQHVFSVLHKLSLSATHAVDTLVNSGEMNQYLAQKNEDSLSSVSRLFLSMTGLDQSFYRIELIDPDNQVLLSVFHGQVIPHETQEKGLQRSFIPHLSPKNDHHVWFSEIMSSQHVFPESAPFHMLYASYPLYIDQDYRGSVVLYYNLDRVLSFLSENDRLEIYLTDKKGKIVFSSTQSNITHPGETTYFQSKFAISDIRSEQQLNQAGFSSMELNALYNGQGLILLSRASSDFLRKKSEWYNSAVIEIFVIVIIFSFCFGLIIAVGPSRTVDKLETVSKEKNTYMRLLDQYVPVFETDKNGVITRCNQAFCLLSQYSESELLGKMSSVLNFNKSDSNIAHIKSILEAGLPWQGEVHYISKRGQEFWLFSTVIPIYGEGRKLNGYMSISTDKTDKKQLEVMSEIDSLTEIHNRAKLDKCLSREYERSKRYGTICSVIMIDVDFFKQVNDNYGHFIGDKVLHQLAKVLNQSTRMVDEVGRWGGEEFMIVCPETSLRDALFLAEKIRETVASHIFPDIGHLTISLGVEAMLPGETLQEILEKVDSYLYKAKSNGRNCVASQEGYANVRRIDHR